MSSFLLLHQCPACLVRLTLIVFVMGSRWPYSWCFVTMITFTIILRLAEFYSIIFRIYIPNIVEQRMNFKTSKNKVSFIAWDIFFEMSNFTVFLDLTIFTIPSAWAGYDTRSIFKQRLTGLNSEFSFSETSCLTKAEEPSLPYYLPIAGGRIIGSLPFPRVLALCEMQSVASRI